MLAVLQLGGKMKKTNGEFLGRSALFLQIPNDKPKTIKKAAKILRGHRLILPDNISCEAFLSAGIFAPDPRGIYRFITDKIYKCTLGKFCLSPSKVSVLLNTVRISEDEGRIIEEIAKNSRYLKINASNSTDMEDALLYEYGIPACNGGEEDIVINMYRQSFSLFLRRPEGNCRLANVKLSPLKGYEQVGEEYRKSAYLFLTESGRVSPRKVQVEEVSFIY